MTVPESNDFFDPDDATYEGELFLSGTPHQSRSPSPTDVQKIKIKKGAIYDKTRQSVEYDDPMLSARRGTVSMVPVKSEKEVIFGKDTKSSSTTASKNDKSTTKAKLTSTHKSASPRHDAPKYTQKTAKVSPKRVVRNRTAKGRKGMAGSELAENKATFDRALLFVKTLHDEKVTIDFFPNDTEVFQRALNRLAKQLKQTDSGLTKAILDLQNQNKHVLNAIDAHESMNGRNELGKQSGCWKFAGRPLINLAADDPFVASDKERMAFMILIEHVWMVYDGAVRQADGDTDPLPGVILALLYSLEFILYDLSKFIKWLSHMQMDRRGRIVCVARAAIMPAFHNLPKELQQNIVVKEVKEKKKKAVRIDDVDCQKPVKVTKIERVLVKLLLDPENSVKLTMANLPESQDVVDFFQIVNAAVSGRAKSLKALGEYIEGYVVDMSTTRLENETSMSSRDSLSTSLSIQQSVEPEAVTDTVTDAIPDSTQRRISKAPSPTQSSTPSDMDDDTAMSAASLLRSIDEDHILSDNPEHPHYSKHQDECHLPQNPASDASVIF